MVVVFQHHGNTIFLEKRDPVLAVHFASAGLGRLVFRGRSRLRVAVGRVCRDMVNDQNVRMVGTCPESPVQPFGLSPVNRGCVPSVEKDKA